MGIHPLHHIVKMRFMLEEDLPNPLAAIRSIVKYGMLVDMRILV